MDHATSYASFNTICYLLIQGNIHPVSISPLSLSMSMGEFETGQMHWLKFSLFKNNLLWANSRQDETVCK